MLNGTGLHHAGHREFTRITVPVAEVTGRGPVKDVRATIRISPLLHIGCSVPNTVELPLSLIPIYVASKLDFENVCELQRFRVPVNIHIRAANYWEKSV